MGGRKGAGIGTNACYLPTLWGSSAQSSPMTGVTPKAEIVLRVLLSAMVRIAPSVT
jgi:hypothetical protein